MTKFTDNVPHYSEFALLTNNDSFTLSITLADQLCNVLCGLGLFNPLAFLSLPLIDLVAGIQYENVSAVQTVGVQWNFADDYGVTGMSSGKSLRFVYLKEASDRLLFIMVVKSTGDTTRKINEVWKIALKQLRLLMLDLAVLNWC